MIPYGMWVPVAGTQGCITSMQTAIPRLLTYLYVSYYVLYFSNTTSTYLLFVVIHVVFRID